MKFYTFSLFLSISLLFSACKVTRFVYYNFADITDYKIFPSNTITTDSIHFKFEKSEAPKKITSVTIDEKQYKFEDFLKKRQTVAFLLIKDDIIQYENYFNGYKDSSIVPSFSMAKSIISILIGCAIDEQLILSVDEPITKYIPELTKNGFDKVTIKHLLQMTSGIKFHEGYADPFGSVATFYYGTNLRKAISKMKLKYQPEEQFKYVSGNSQLLGLVLERALKGKSISLYLEEKLWKPLQMEYDATWSLDRKNDGLEKTFCCLNARARDFAKIGRLFLNKGKWNGKQIVSEKWVEESTKIDITNGSAWYYQYQWWLPTKDGDYMAQGILGQYIYVNPMKNIIIVRLGSNHGQVNWKEVFVSLANSY